MKSLSEVLSELPEWSDDWKAHALFCAYDQDTSEEFIVSFWKRAISKILEEHISELSIECLDLKSLVQRKGRFPLGLQDITKELIRRGDLVSIETLREQAENKKSSQAWGSWIGKKIQNIWANAAETTRIASLAKLQKASEQVLRFCRENTRSTFLADEISNFAGISQKDLRILLDFMFLQDLALEFKENRDNSIVEMVKFKLFDEEIKVRPEDSVIVTMNLTISDIDKRIEELGKTKEFLHGQVIAQLKAQNKVNAKHFLQRRKMVEQKIEHLLGSRLNIEEQLLNLSNSMTNMNVVKTIKNTNLILQQFSPNIKEVTEIMDASKDYNDMQKDISSIISENFMEVEDDEILKEFEALDELEIPSVPTYPLKVEVQEKVPVKKSEIVLNS